MFARLIASAVATTGTRRSRWLRAAYDCTSKRLLSRLRRPAPAQTLEEERKKYSEHKGSHTGNRNIPNYAGSRVTLGGNRQVEELDHGSVSRLSNPRLLELLSQEGHEDLLNLDLAGEPHELETHLGDASERHREVTSLARLGLPYRLIPVLHLRKLAVHFADATPHRDDLRIRLGGEVPHHLKLHLGGNDLALQPRRRFDGALCLLLQDDRTILLLKPAQGLLGCIEVNA